MKYKELNTEKLSWEEYAKLLEEKNKALTQKAERLAAENIVLRDKCARAAAISSRSLLPLSYRNQRTFFADDTFFNGEELSTSVVVSLTTYPLLIFPIVFFSLIMLRMSLQYQLCLQMDEMQLQLDL
ncbi:hypothetical protein B9Z55_026583 [Caenorhabditis nigoni]|uniref:Uncharacterized protein n=1 Tax=Caenorhabditis nigoni TaxID=1611254 RepID=A0A2G5T3R7_9PELO|nr:hypothetical protein B9Z55_026583 [Caenorhabditis nigoni]